MFQVNFLKRNLPLQDMGVYITGSSKLQTRRAEEICKYVVCKTIKISDSYMMFTKQKFCPRSVKRHIMILFLKFYLKYPKLV